MRPQAADASAPELVAPHGPALVAWSRLVQGGGALVACFERAGRRFVIARATPHGPCPVAALSARETLIAARVASGEALKRISCDRGIATSTVSVELRAVVRKLGLASRLDLASALDPWAHCWSPLASAQGKRFRMTRFTVRGSELLVVSRAVGSALGAVPADLSPAERSVVDLVLAGLTNEEIAALRRRSVWTVRNQLAATYEKLGVHSRAELAAKLASSWSPQEALGAAE